MAPERVIPPTNVGVADQAPLAAVVHTVGPGPTALLACVSRTHYKVYPGVFRGPAETLADNAGNDYDRALLLHDLLAASVSASDLRYAFCSLSAEQSAAAARSAYVVPQIIAASAQTLAGHAPTPQLRAGPATVKYQAAHIRHA
jgi:hypothetical protein